MKKIEFLATQNQSVFEQILSNQPQLNFSVLKTILRKKDIKINGKKITQNVDVCVGDTITFYLPQTDKKQVPVVFEDDNILIAFKPQGMEVTKADKVFSNSACLEDVFDGAFACHRLDKNTEGLVVLAKNQQTQMAMFEVFKQHKVKKFYKAICFGNINKNGQNLVDYYSKTKNGIKVFSQKQQGATQIKTNYVYQKNIDNFCLLDIQILTGKTHQIRVHLAHHKIYIVGDEKYGNKQINKQCKTKKQKLCAYKLIFENMPKNLSYLNNKIFQVEPTFINYHIDN